MMSHIRVEKAAVDPGEGDVVRAAVGEGGRAVLVVRTDAGKYELRYSAGAGPEHHLGKRKASSSGLSTMHSAMERTHCVAVDTDEDIVDCAVASGTDSLEVFLALAGGGLALLKQSQGRGQISRCMVVRDVARVCPTTFRGIAAVVTKRGSITLASTAGGASVSEFDVPELPSKIKTSPKAVHADSLANGTSTIVAVLMKAGNSLLLRRCRISADAATGDFLSEEDQVFQLSKLGTGCTVCGIAVIDEHQFALCVNDSAGSSLMIANTTGAAQDESVSLEIVYAQKGCTAPAVARARDDAVLFAAVNAKGRATVTVWSAVQRAVLGTHDIRTATSQPVIAASVYPNAGRPLLGAGRAVMDIHVLAPRGVAGLLRSQHIGTATREWENGGTADTVVYVVGAEKPAKKAAVRKAGAMDDFAFAIAKYDAFAGADSRKLVKMIADAKTSKAAERAAEAVREAFASVDARALAYTCVDFGQRAPQAAVGLLERLPSDPAAFRVAEAVFDTGACCEHTARPLVQLCARQGALAALEAAIAGVPDLGEIALVSILDAALAARQAHDQALAERWSNRFPRSRAQDVAHALAREALTVPVERLRLASALRGLSSASAATLTTLLADIVERGGSGSRSASPSPSLVHALDWASALIDAHGGSATAPAELRAACGALVRAVGVQLDVCAALRDLGGCLAHVRDGAALPARVVPAYSVERIEF